MENMVKSSKKEYNFIGSPAELLSDVMSIETILTKAMDRIRQDADPELTYYLLSNARLWLSSSVSAYVRETTKFDK